MGDVVSWLMDALAARQRRVYTLEVDAPVEAVFAWHQADDALSRMTPPHVHQTIVSQSGSIAQPGARLTMDVRPFPFLKVRWVAELFGYSENRHFCDQQVSGPFWFWLHQHRFEPLAENRCRIVDTVDYLLPFGLLGCWVAGAFIARDIDRLFDYRHSVVLQAFPRYDN